jgi:cytochrome c
MKNAGVTWDAATLDRFIANPDQVIPNNKMKPYGGLTDANVRKQIVEFLESQGKGS